MWPPHLPGCRFIPHVASPYPFCRTTNFTLHLDRRAAIIPKCLAIDLTANHIELDKDGFIHVPDAPGLGMTVNGARLKNYLVDAEIRVKGQVIYRTPNLD